MILEEILKDLADDGNPLLFDKSEVQAEARILLDTLSETTLKVKAHLQPGMYIAEINDEGYLGSILFRFKRRVTG